MGNNAEPLVRFENVSVSYWLRQGIFRRKKHYALRNISFDLYPGDTLGVVGRNGCGKSTLLRLMAGVMTPDEGRIIKRDDLRVSLLSLQLGFVKYLSGRENVILSGTMLGMSKSEIEAKIDDIVAFSELGDFINHPIATYSAGMRARLGFAIAFQLNPDILLVDEVLGVGDAEFRQKSMHHMHERIQSKQSTIVFVSHSANQVRDMCTSAIWLESGRVVRAGDAAAVIKQYEGSLGTSDTDAVMDQINRNKLVFVRSQDAKTVHFVVDGRMQPVGGMVNFNKLGGRFEDVKVLPSEIFNELRETMGHSPSPSGETNAPVDLAPNNAPTKTTASPVPVRTPPPRQENGLPTPNLIILGSQKSGTTSLHRYLHKHRLIFMSSPVKEAGYYWGLEQARRYHQHQGRKIESTEQLLRDHMLTGYKDEPYFGDSSTYYTIGHAAKNCAIPERIHAACGDNARFIFLMRNPLARLVSAYLHRHAHRGLEIPLDEHVATKHGMADITTSRYYYQISQYLEVFSPDQFYFALFEDFVKDPAQVLKEIYAFLEVPTPSQMPEFDIFNKSSNKGRFAASDLLFSAQTYDKLIATLAPEVDQIEELLGRSTRDVWDLTKENWSRD